MCRFKFEYLHEVSYEAIYGLVRGEYACAYESTTKALTCFSLTDAEVERAHKVLYSTGAGSSKSPIAAEFADFQNMENRM